MKFLGRFILWCFSLGVFGLVAGIASLLLTINHFSQDLPDYTQLADYRPAIATRIHAGDGHLMGEFATEKRVFVPVRSIPQKVINAFLAAEDKNFYKHNGIDFQGIARAIIVNIRNLGSNRRPVGASTITQQVAKNFLLSNELSYKRKIREAILAFRMEKTYTKNRILELYLNEIFLGRGNYGVAAAALDYFGKSLEELTVEEAAYLAALPKAPNNYQVDRNEPAAIGRRNWVITRMAEDGYINDADADRFKSIPLKVRKKSSSAQQDGEYFNEEVRRFLSNKYGENALYEGGLSVRTSLNPEYQKAAAKALATGLREYDKRHGWRGPVKHLQSTDDWQLKLSVIDKPKGSKEWLLAVVLGTNDTAAQIGLADGIKGSITMESMRWARAWKEHQRLGDKVDFPSQILKNGDVILVGKVADSKNTYTLEQIPKVQGALLVMDPHTGRILAMQGGYDYEMSEFNRATQAKRQPGSSFKPFIYLAALNNGFTPSNLILDAPVTLDQGPGLPKWTPTNYSGDYYGLTTLRVGVEKSRNLMTVRLADHLGMNLIKEYAEKFGVTENMPMYLSSALGSIETTLERMTAAYSMLDNGGKRIEPTMIDRIQDRNGKTVFKHDERTCENCGDRIAWNGQTAPLIPDNREQLSDTRTVYQMTSILEGVIERGTALKAKELNRPLAGKTGTTNDYKDAWFIGFTPDLVIGTYIGFDEPSTLGSRETGASAALPIFINFVKDAMKDVPPVPFRIPEGLRLMKVNPETGKVASADDKKAIWESFLPGTEPSENMLQLDDDGVKSLPPQNNDIPAHVSANSPEQPVETSTSTSPAPASDAATTGTGELY